MTYTVEAQPSHLLQGNRYSSLKPTLVLCLAYLYFTVVMCCYS